MFPRKVGIVVLIIGATFARWSIAELNPAPGRLLTRTRWCQLDIVGGQVRLVEPRLGHKAALTTESKETGATEAIAFSATALNSATLQYEYQDQHELWQVDAQRSRQVSIHRRIRSETGESSITYRQPEQGSVSLTLTSDGQTKKVAAADFWRLVLAEPKLCEEHLFPVLEVLRPDWHLADRGRQVAHALYSAAKAQRVPDHERLQQLITELGDDDFRKRQAAHRELKAMGQRIASFLNDLDLSELDAERRVRIRELRKGLRVRDSDTPQRVAAWLIDDRATWLSLLQRDDLQQRQLAVEHLERLLDRAIVFDALAPEKQRQQQLSSLQRELGLEVPVLVSEASPPVIRR